MEQNKPHDVDGALALVSSLNNNQKLILDVNHAFDNKRCVQAANKKGSCGLAIPKEHSRLSKRHHGDDKGELRRGRSGQSCIALLVSNKRCILFTLSFHK